MAIVDVHERGERAPTEQYALRDHAAWEQALQMRRADTIAAFFLPYLRPTMRLLDAGCGPGSITLGLAEVVAPGHAVGVDVQAHQVELARSVATARGLTNVSFEQADVYGLPFPDASFDAAFAHTLLFHLKEPVRALRELRRVLRPGGIIGVRDWDMGGYLFSPTTPLLELKRDLESRVYQLAGADPFRARTLRALLLEAGFSRTESEVVVSSAGSLDATRRIAVGTRARFLAVARTAVEHEWADQSTVDAIAADIEAWGERPDAVYGVTAVAVIGWVYN